MDCEFAQSLNLNLQPLSHPIPVYNVDKTPNKNGPICKVLTLCMKIMDHVKTATFVITNTGQDKVILGLSWLHHHNPSVDWKASKLLFNRCPSQCNTPQEWENKDEEIIRGVDCGEEEEDKHYEINETPMDESEHENLEEGERLMMLPGSVDHFIRMKTMFSQQIAEKETKRMKARKKEVTSIPDQYVKDFGPIF